MGIMKAFWDMKLSKKLPLIIVMAALTTCITVSIHNEIQYRGELFHLAKESAMHSAYLRKDMLESEINHRNKEITIYSENANIIQAIPQLTAIHERQHDERLAHVNAKEVVGGTFETLFKKNLIHFILKHFWPKICYNSIEH